MSNKKDPIRLLYNNDNDDDDDDDHDDDNHSHHDNSMFLLDLIVFNRENIIDNFAFMY